jgi:hypothetical protein
MADLKSGQKMAFGSIGTNLLLSVMGQFSGSVRFAQISVHKLAFVGANTKFAIGIFYSREINSKSQSCILSRGQFRWRDTKSIYPIISLENI